MRHSPYQTSLAPASLVLVAALLAGCGGSDTSSQSEAPTSPSTSSSTPVVCSDLTAVKDSVAQLQNVTIAKGAGEEVQTDLNKIEQDLKTLSGDAQQQIAPQVEALTSSLDALSTQLKSLQSDTSTANLAAVRAAIRSVGTAAASLATAVSTTC